MAVPSDIQTTFLLGRLDWNAIPQDPIVWATGVVVAIGGAGLLWMLHKYRLWSYLWHEWFTTVDHKKIGIMYVVLALVMFVRGFADEIGADVDWRVGAESELAEWLDGGDIDVVIGGFQANSPWTEEIAFTRPYEEVEADGVTRKMVMGVRRGENRMLVELERYLSRATGEI